VKDRLVDALKKSTADYTEIRFEQEDATIIAFRGRELEQVSSSKLSGGIVRACVRGGWGQATFEDPDDLPRQVEEACQSAALVGRETTRLAEVDGAVDAECPAQMQRDFRGVPLDEKLKLITEYNDIILGTDPAIESSSVAYRDSFRTVHFASSRGRSFTEERPRLIVSLGAMARRGALVQRAHEGISSATSYEAAEDLEQKARATARRAVALLTAPPCEGGAFTVVLDPDLTGVFVHEAFGHLSEADHIYENDKMRELMAVGRKMGGTRLNIYDDGSIPGLIGTQSFDDEGTPTGRTDLIREGVLVGHLHSLETAGKMGARPTGNARAIRRHCPPLVRMTNTCLAGGDDSFQDLIADVDDGIYARSFIGGTTEMEMFTFSAAYGYRIRRGQVGELVRDIVLTGNVFRTLHDIDGFGNDFQVLQRGGGCGKGGQAPLPVTCGAPHIRIRNVVVGGRQGGAA